MPARNPDMRRTFVTMINILSYDTVQNRRRCYVENHERGLTVVKRNHRPVESEEHEMKSLGAVVFPNLM